MISRPQHGLLLLLAGGFAWALGCGRDYDSLFAESPVAAADASPPDGSANAAPDTSGDGASCGPVCAGERCDFTCSAACECRAAAAACPEDSRCGFDCQSGSSCSPRCGEKAEGCDVVCRPGARCEVRCERGPCTLVCEPGSRCSMKCDGSGSCDVDCQGAPRVSCEDGEGCGSCPD